MTSFAIYADPIPKEYGYFEVDGYTVDGKYVELPLVNCSKDDTFVSKSIL